MSPQTAMLDTFDTFHNAQPSFMSSNSNTYTTYAGNLQQYSNITGASFTDSWNLLDAPTGYNASSHPRTGASNPTFTPQPAQSGFTRGSYPSYPPSSPSYMLPEPQRPHSYQGSHSRSGMLSMPRNTGRERGVAWEGSRGHPLQGEVSDMSSEVFGWSPHPADNQFLTFDPLWNNIMSSSLNSPSDLHLLAQEYSNYTLEISPVSPPQPRSAAAYALRHVSPTSSSSSPPMSRSGSVDIPHPSRKVCSHCQATSTPLWRREPATLKPLCNACGLYLQQRNKHRPQELIDADAADDSDESDGDASGPECSHCHTHHTSVWRRSKTGAQLCNACGVYSRLRGKDRPLSLKRNKIKPRSKHTPPAASTR